MHILGLRAIARCNGVVATLHGCASRIKFYDPRLCIGTRKSGELASSGRIKLFNNVEPVTVLRPNHVASRINFAQVAIAVAILQRVATHVHRSIGIKQGIVGN